MNTIEFNALFESVVDHCRSVLCYKASEYAEDNDRLHNFNQAAHLQGGTVISALGGMMIKHTVSVYDLIRREAKGQAVSDELFDEKIIDSINYLILLKAAVTAQQAQPHPDPFRPRCVCCGGDIAKGRHICDACKAEGARAVQQGQESGEKL